MIRAFTSSLNFSKRGLYSLGPTLLKPLSALCKEKNMYYSINMEPGRYGSWKLTDTTLNFKSHLERSWPNLKQDSRKEIFWYR